ncbi:hypothetical protein ABTX82_29570 [Streptomyces lavendulae]|uniref:hypothetical protein n=1 Tax=Streptomyces lavendulae TaxID=1914 RepID=UPI0024A374D9|nr:hypothetical protein [Streptomyces lavendulae]GLW01585.1 hypothetical protein Slala05_52160 [Streptomyces lavendulae subsp. lavendulae]
MTFHEGLRVELAADTRLSDRVAITDATADGPEGGPGDEEAAGGAVGSLWLAAGTPGTVVEVATHDRPSHGAREYERLASLLDSFGRDMPAQSRERLEEQIAALEPDWAAYQEQRLRVTLRVRFDNGFILDGVPDTFFTAA